MPGIHGFRFDGELEIIFDVKKYLTPLALMQMKCVWQGV